VDQILTQVEVRVLGSLIEKQITTPEYYPLTLNSLTAACNQKNNRNPITSLAESEVDEALYSLRDKNLAYVFHGSTSRVPKYKHVAPEVLHLTPPELAAMCVLMLSGPQTVGGPVLAVPYAGLYTDGQQRVVDQQFDRRVDVGDEVP